MKKLIFKILFFVAAVYLLQGCFEHKTEYFYLDQEVKDYYVFKEGCYWIYQDSATNSTDSVVLKQVAHDFEKRRNNFGNIMYLYETYKNNYHHYLYDTSVVFTHSVAFDRPVRVDPFQMIAFSFENSNIVTNRIFGIPFKNIKYSLIEYSILENTFNNVMVGGDTVKSYWAKNIGLIRYEIYSSDTTILNTYNLIKYNVSQ